MDLASGIPDFIIYFLATIAYLSLFIFVYNKVTPYDDFQLIHEGNRAAAINIGGAIIGFSIPLAKCVEQAYVPIDFFLWATVAFCAQMVAYKIVERALPGVGDKISHEKDAPAIFMAAISISLGVLIAACMAE